MKTSHFINKHWIGALLAGLLMSLALVACGDTASTPLPRSATEEQAAYIAPAAPAPATPVASSQGLNQTGGTIRIYSSLPLTGSGKDQSQTLVNAMQMALEDVAGPEKTIGGFKIDFVSLDDATAQRGQWDEATEKANAQKAVNDPDAMVYLGPYNSGAAKISIPILNQAGIAIISPSATYPGLTHAVQGITTTNEPNIYKPTGTQNFFRVAVPDDSQGPAAAQFAIAQGAKRFFVVSDQDVYGKGLASAFAGEVRNKGLTVVNNPIEEINGHEDNYRDLARRIRSANPDFIFFGGTAQNQPGKLLIDIRAAGVSAPFMGGDGINNPAFIKDSAVAGLGAFSSISGVSPDKLPTKGQDFIKRYTAKYGAPTAYTINGYEIMSVALNAIKTAGTHDRKAILQAIAGTRNFDGVLGRWSFDSSGDISLKTFAFYQIQDGAFVAYTAPGR